MKKIGFWLLPLVLFCGCTSTSDEPEAPTTLEIDTPLGCFFSEVGDAMHSVNTLTAGGTYQINLYPYSKSPEGYEGYVSEVTYYLNGAVVGKSSASPFSISYKVVEAPGEYTLTVKPVTSIKWGAVNSATVEVVAE